MLRFDLGTASYVKPVTFPEIVVPWIST
jgi:hypothetical protein